MTSRMEVGSAMELGQRDGDHSCYKAERRADTPRRAARKPPGEVRIDEVRVVEMVGGSKAVRKEYADEQPLTRAASVLSVSGCGACHAPGSFSTAPSLEDSCHNSPSMAFKLDIPTALMGWYESSPLFASMIALKCTRYLSSSVGQ